MMNANCIELHSRAQKEGSFYSRVDCACYINWARLLHSDHIWGVHVVIVDGAVDKA
jgi:hypothetical protein